MTSTTRSATGSRTLPKVLTWWNLLARKPSRKSVTPTTMSTMVAAILRFGPNSSQQNRPRSRMRVREITFGSVKTRSRLPSSPLRALVGATSTPASVRARALAGREGRPELQPSGAARWRVG